MTLNLVVIVTCLVMVVLMFNQTGQISVQAASAHLKTGARVIGVRSHGKYNAGHRPLAVNLKCDKIEIVVPRRLKDKNQVLLLLCLSGVRSGMAKGKLKQTGCPNVFNLGSYGRAEKIVNTAS